MALKLKQMWKLLACLNQLKATQERIHTGYNESEKAEAGLVLTAQSTAKFGWSRSCRTLIWRKRLSEPILKSLSAGLQSSLDFVALRVASLSTQGQRCCSLKTSTGANLILQKPQATACIFSHSVAVSVPTCPFI